MGSVKTVLRVSLICLQELLPGAIDPGTTYPTLLETPNFSGPIDVKRKLHFVKRILKALFQGPKTRILARF